MLLLLLLLLLLSSRPAARLSHRPPEQLLQEHSRREQDGVQLPRAVQAQRNFSRRVRSQVRGLLVRVRLVPVHTRRS